MKFGAGARTRRLEDRRFITGQGRYGDDIVLPGQFRIGFLRATAAHARIGTIDLSAALEMPGIVAGATGRDLVDDGVGAIPILRSYPGPDGGGMISPARYPIAVDTIRHVGEIVAAMVGDTEGQIDDALEAVALTTDDLAATFTIASAIGEGAPLVCPEAGSNTVTRSRFGEAAAVEALFASAAHVVELHLVNQRIVAAPLEPRSLTALPDMETGRIVLMSGSQNPTATLSQLAGTLGLPPEGLRIQVPDIGGGFGMRGYLYPEEAIVTYFASKLGRPVKWRGSRIDDFLGATHARDQESDIAMAFDDDYRILALRSRTYANLGAYPGPAGPILALTLGPKVATSVYDIPAIDIEVCGVLTNTQSTGPYRGAGRPEAIYATERLLDHAAVSLGIDPVEIRRRNLIPSKAIPYRTAIGEVYDSGDFPAIHDQAVKIADWAGFAERKAASEARGLLRGIGLSMFIEWTGGSAFTEAVRIAVRADGIILAESATIPMGQGLHTSFAQILGALFDVDPERIVLATGDTDVSNGFGSFGSRSLFVGGSALAMGGREVLSVLRNKASGILEVSTEDLEYAAGVFSVAGTDHAVSIFEIAAGEEHREVRVPFTYTVKGESWPNGAHVCEVEVDPHTGKVDVVRYTCVDDAGTIINPLLVEGQIQGGVLQGIGQALMEQVIYDLDSGQLITATFQDYCIPRADDVSIIRSELDQSSPCINNPLGAKGVGESGTVGAPAAVMSAVLDALRPLGVDHLDMPATPGKVWTAIQQAGESIVARQSRPAKRR